MALYDSNTSVTSCFRISSSSELFCSLSGTLASSSMTFLSECLIRSLSTSSNIYCSFSISLRLRNYFVMCTMLNSLSMRSAPISKSLFIGPVGDVETQYAGRCLCFFNGPPAQQNYRYQNNKKLLLAEIFGTCVSLTTYCCSFGIFFDNLRFLAYLALCLSLYGDSNKLISVVLTK